MSGVLTAISRYASAVAGIFLTVMMLLTFADVILRAGGVPIIGTYEIVSLLLALVVALGLPQVTNDRGHVCMEFLVERLGKKARRIMNLVTRIFAVFLFLMAGLYLMEVGKVYRLAGEVTATMRIPFYPFAYTVAFCCFIQCLVLVRELINLWRQVDE